MFLQVCFFLFLINIVLAPGYKVFRHSENYLKLLKRGQQAGTEAEYALSEHYYIYSVRCFCYFL